MATERTSPGVGRQRRLEGEPREQRKRGGKCQMTKIKQFRRAFNVLCAGLLKGVEHPS